MFANYNAFLIPWVAIYFKTSKFYLFFRSSIMSTPTKAKRNTLSTAKKKDFLLLRKERAVADLLDKCWIAVATGNIHMKTSQEQK